MSSPPLVQRRTGTVPARRATAGRADQARMSHTVPPESLASDGREQIRSPQRILSDRFYPRGMGVSIPEEIDSGSDPGHPIRRMLRRSRAWVELHPKVRWVYRVLVGLLGAGIVGVGLILVPLPGPGWLIVFLGIAVLGTEFPAAHRVSAFLRRILTRFLTWWRNRRAAASRTRRVPGGTAATD